MFGSIRWRLLTTYLIVVSSACVFLGLHLSREFQATYIRRVEADLLDLARLVALNAFQGLSTNDPAEVRLHLQGAHHGGGGPLIVITDASGTVVGVRGVPESVVGQRDTEPSIGKALRGEEVTGVGAAHESDGAAYAAVPVYAGPGSRVFGAVHVSLPLSLFHVTLRHIRWVIAGSVVAALIVAGALGLVLARGIAGPVQEMQRVASDLAAGRLGERVPIRSRDELGELARSLNRMAGDLERIDAARRAFVADAAHELRTPVANLAVAIEALKAVIDKSPDQVAGVVTDLGREVQRLTTLVEHLLDLSLVESGQVRLHASALSPAELILRSVHPFEKRAAQAGVTIATDVPPRLPRVAADADRMVQVLTGLLDNALKVTPPGGRITMRASEQRGRVLFSVADTGPGIAEAELVHIFDRFYRTDRARTREQGGAGLGLAIAKRLVEAQGGTITVESKEGQGARFVVTLPKAS